MMVLNKDNRDKYLRLASMWLVVRIIGWDARCALPLDMLGGWGLGLLLMLMKLTRRLFSLHDFYIV